MHMAYVNYPTLTVYKYIKAGRITAYSAINHFMGDVTCVVLCVLTSVIFAFMNLNLFLKIIE
jgi:hypothetical protein